jgi:5-methylthioadenosine/S-adenosylhomocysteine deaminase
MHCDLLIKSGYILPMDKEMTVIKDGFIAIQDKKIIAIGEISKSKERFSSSETIDCGNSLSMPGLINTHTHAGMAYFRGIADDLPLKTWLEDHIWPAEAKYVNPDFIEKSTELACLEMIKSGITCFCDMYFFEEKVGAVASQAGLRAVLGEVILDFPTPSAKKPEDGMAKTLEQYQMFKDSELIKISFAPHSIYACHQDNLKNIIEKADSSGLMRQIHLSETKKEYDDAMHNFKKSPVKYLSDLGFLSQNTLLEHAVWLEADDMGIIKEHGASIAHCPTSNMKLASGIAPIPKMRQKNLNVALGTDGAASNNTLDIFSEMCMAALLHKVANMDPTVLSAPEAVQMATVNGAGALGLGDRIGTLEIGKHADLITIGLSEPHLAPIYDPYSHLAYCVRGSDVRNVIVNGKIIMKNRVLATLDEERILYDASNYFE